MQNEPVITKAILQVIAAIFVLFGAFGLEVDEGVRAAILAICAAVLPIAFGLWARQDVTPVANPRDNEGRQLVPIFEDGDEWND